MTEPRIATGSPTRTRPNGPRRRSISSSRGRSRTDGRGCRNHAHRPTLAVMRHLFLAAITMTVALPAHAQVTTSHICGDTALYGASLLEDVAAIVTGEDRESVEARQGKLPRMR